MASRRNRFFALVFAAPLWTAAPTACAQEAPPPAKLDGDEQKLLDLLNRGMDLERTGKRRDAEAIYRRWTGEAPRGRTI